MKSLRVLGQRLTLQKEWISPLTEFIRGKLLALRDRGAAILLVSEDLDEILALSDRIVVDLQRADYRFVLVNEDTRALRESPR